MLSAIASEQLYDETSTSRAGTVLKQAEFIPGLLQQLQGDPNKVVEDFEAIRQICESCYPLPKLPVGEPTLFYSNQTRGNQILGHRERPRCSKPQETMAGAFR